MSQEPDLERCPKCQHLKLVCICYHKGAHPCCDTCEFFVIMPNDVDTDGRRWGWCNGPLPPWAETFLSIAGRDVSRTYPDSGSDCDVHMPTSAPLPRS